MLTRKIEVIPKKWGKELIFVNAKGYGYCGKMLVYKKDWASSLHCHNIKNETFFVIKGSFILDWIPKGADLEKYQRKMIQRGDIIDIPAMTYHRLISFQDGSTIVEFSQFHDDRDVKRLVESRKLDFFKYEDIKGEQKDG